MKSPAFQFYPADYASSQRVRLMTLEEEGAYINLLCSCWLHGSIPADPEMAARLVGKGCSTTLATTVLTMFTPSIQAGRMVHDRLERERLKQSDWREKSASGGRKSAELRKGASTTVQPPLPNGINQKATLQSSVSSLQSLSTSLALANTASVPAAASSPASEPSKSAPKFDPSAVDLPENLNSARMRDAWTQWCIYRKERKQPMTAQTVKLQLAAMSKWGEPYTVSAIEKSIMNSWRGVFAPNDGAGNQSKTPAQKSEFADAF